MSIIGGNLRYINLGENRFQNFIFRISTPNYEKLQRQNDS